VRFRAVLTSVEGIYRNGEVELLERPEGLGESRVIVTFLPATIEDQTRAKARERMLARMREGISLGGPPYPSREEIYRRGDGD
jgi:hypothetical protein